MLALLAFARGEYAAAAQALYAVRGKAQRFGGSHAQRDLIDQVAAHVSQPVGGNACRTHRGCCQQRSCRSGE